MNAPTPHPTRRRFLTGLGVSAATAGLLGPAALSRADGALAGQPVAYQSRSAADPGLILVSVQLAGGMDFLDTVVPISDTRYGALRPDPTDEASLQPLDADYSLSSMPYLASAWDRGDLAIVHGVGHPDSSLSHFDATDMWEKGSTDFHTRTGWLGRSLDQLVVDPDPLLGVSVGPLSPSMRAADWRPYALANRWELPWTRDFAEEHPALAVGLNALIGDADGSDLTARVRQSQALVRDVGGRLEPLLDAYDDESEHDEDGESVMAADFRLVADMINAGIPTRAFHLSLDGFDTHAEQHGLLPVLLGALDSGIRSFHEALGPNADRVVVATWTEFGRRPEWNGQGTEHGTAGVQFVVGPRVAGGHHGEPSPLDRFDHDGNFLVTTDFRDYLGGVVQSTLGVAADRALPGSTRPLEVLR